MTANTSAIEINNISSLKFQKTIEEYMIPQSLEEFIASELESYRETSLDKAKKLLEKRYSEHAQNQYRQNPNIKLPNFTDSKEAALFLYNLLTYWSERQIIAVFSCSNWKEKQIWFKPGSDCGSCVSGRTFIEALFGKDYRKLPFIGKYGSYITITTDALREYTLT